MPEDKSGGERTFRKFLEWIGYVVLIVLLVFMLLAQLLPDLVTFVSYHVIAIGLLTGLIAFLIYFDTRISRNKRFHRDVLRELEERSNAILKELAELKSGIIQHGTIWDLFAAAMPITNYVEELRIFALNTDKIFSVFHDHKNQFRAGNLFLLLHSSDRSRSNYESWENMTPSRITKIDCAWNDQKPSSYFVIFNRDCMILGGYYPKPDIPSKHYYIHPFIVRDTSVIDSYIMLHKATMEFHRAEEQ